MVGVENVKGAKTGVRIAPGYLAMVFKAVLGPSFHTMRVKANSRFGRKSDTRLTGIHQSSILKFCMYMSMVFPFARREVRTVVNTSGKERWQNPPQYLSAGMTLMGPTFRKLVMPKVADSPEVTNKSHAKTFGS